MKWKYIQRWYFIHCTCTSVWNVLKPAFRHSSCSSFYSYNTPHVSMFSLTALPVLGNVRAMRQPNPQVRLLWGGSHRAEVRFEWVERPSTARECAVGNTYESRRLSGAEYDLSEGDRIARVVAIQKTRQTISRRRAAVSHDSSIFLCVRMRIKPRVNQRVGDCPSDKRPPSG